MKKWFYTIAILLIALPAMARHVAGGELFYEYLGPGTNSNSSAPTSSYRITLRLFRDCASTGPVLESEQVTVGIYSNDNLSYSLYLPRIGEVTTISLNTSVFPCLVGNVSVCYQIGIYSATIDLPDNTGGYTLSRTGCCRVDNISNLYVKLNVGSNYVTKIPGKATLPSGHNSSPQFLIKDTALVCANKPFKLDFGAVDPDGDALSFYFCNAYTAASGSSAASPPSTLSLTPLPYTGLYSGNYPLGLAVGIDPTTGVISGIAPPEGSYVVNVCITESRNGVPFNEHRKDFILKVQNCDFIEADLPPKIIQCNDFVVHFENGSTSSSITSYLWNFGNDSTSNSPTVDYTYKDTGRYIASLTVTGPKGCVGSDSTLVLVYPGFKPGFTISGSCYQNPFLFADSTITSYGLVNSWLWNFGDETNSADTSTKKNPTYTYAAPSVKDVSLVVTNTKGCIDSLHKSLLVSAKPLLQLPFKDTLICSIDTLPIVISNPGNFSWFPNTNILYANTSSPLVFPKTTTKYIVQVVDNGCVNSDTVTVNVLDFIRVNLGNDSTVCAGDTFRLNPVSAALSYQWRASTGELVNNVKYPLVQPFVNTQYYVLANLGKCQDRDTLFIKTVPYPIAKAGPDTAICFGNKFQINAFIKGASFQWSPTGSLSNALITNPIAIPSKTTTYVLTVTDTIGCPKPFSDSIVITVVPPIQANAGRDTAILVNQPLQLNATGGSRYEWSPETGLSNAAIPNPVAILDERFTSILYHVRVYGQGGCYGDDDVLVKVFKTGPEIFVPSAFTPNGDGKNDVLKPITVGISVLKYFSVYNRWGQLLFTTSEIGKGWDGNFANAQQPAGTYVFMAEGIDYLGKAVFRKGTSVLIR
jgi:gliding motility-associated-like protein